jgi:hypothetical protein
MKFALPLIVTLFHLVCTSAASCNATLRVNWSAGAQIVDILYDSTITSCCAACLAAAPCVVFVVDGSTCYLKADVANSQAKNGNTAGFLRAPAPPPVPTPTPRPPPPPGAPWFSLSSAQPVPAIGKSTGMQYGIGRGFEGGRWLDAGSVASGLELGPFAFAMIASEAINDLPSGHPLWDLHMTVGLWVTANTAGSGNWTRLKTLLNSSSDCSGVDPCGAIFSPFTGYDPADGHVHLFATCYATPGCHQVNGQQMLYTLSVPGNSLAALEAGEFVDRSVALNIEGAGGDPAWWEGNGNCTQLWPNASSAGRYTCAGHRVWGLHPFHRLTNGTWLALYGSSWHVGLAAADSGLGGKWRRIGLISDKIDGPWPAQGPSIENPIVTRTADGKFFVMVWDAMTRYWPERINMVGLSYAAILPDAQGGLSDWAPAQYLLVEPANGTFPCGSTRTPYGLIATNRTGEYLMLFTGDTGTYENVCQVVLMNHGEL